jgi:hypothetical protein
MFRGGPDRHLGAEIAEELYAHAGLREVTEVVFALPFSSQHEDHVQILTDMAERLGPALGWKPSACPRPGSTPAASAARSAIQLSREPARLAMAGALRRRPLVLRDAQR